MGLGSDNYTKIISKFYCILIIQGSNVDHTIFPPVCLPSKDEEFVGTASVYGNICKCTVICGWHLVLLFIGWGQTGMEHIRQEPANTCSMDSTYTFTRREEFGKLLEVEVLLDLSKAQFFGPWFFQMISI